MNQGTSHRAGVMLQSKASSGNKQIQFKNRGNGVEGGGGLAWKQYDSQRDGMGCGKGTHGSGRCNN